MAKQTKCIDADIAALERQINALQRQLATTSSRKKRALEACLAAEATLTRARASKKTRQPSSYASSKLRSRYEKTLLAQSRIKDSIAAAGKSLQKLESAKKRRDSMIQRADRAWNREYNRKLKAPLDICGKQLKAARATLGMSQVAFANWLELPISMLKRIERPAGGPVLAQQTVKAVIRKLRSAGIDIIQKGFYFGDGGPGFRISPNKVASFLASAPSGRRPGEKKRRLEREKTGNLRRV